MAPGRGSRSVSKAYYRLFIKMAWPSGCAICFLEQRPTICNDLLSNSFVFIYKLLEKI